jgi:hypothetical protein
MKKFLQHWDTFWTKPVPPHALAIFRIAAGAHLLIYWLGYLRSLDVLFSNRGPVVAFFIHLPIPSLWMVIVGYVLMLVSLFSLMIGYRANLSASIAFVLELCAWILSLHHFGTSFDMLYLFCLFVMSFANSDRALSMREYLRTKTFTSWEPVSILPQRLLALQMTMTYAGVAWQKAWLPDWQNGKILRHSFTGVWSTSFARFFAAHIQATWFYDLTLHTVKYIEFWLPFGLWIKQTQKLTFVLGAFFHATLILFLGMWWFIPMVASYVLFLDPHEVQTFVEKHITKR